jgi:hypothetical protein
MGRLLENGKFDMASAMKISEKVSDSGCALGGKSLKISSGERHLSF